MPNSTTEKVYAGVSKLAVKSGIDVSIEQLRELTVRAVKRLSDWLRVNADKEAEEISFPIICFPFIGAKGPADVQTYGTGEDLAGDIFDILWNGKVSYLVNVDYLLRVKLLDFLVAKCRYLYETRGADSDSEKSIIGAQAWVDAWVESFESGEEVKVNVPDFIRECVKNYRSVTAIPDKKKAKAGTKDAKEETKAVKEETEISESESKAEESETEPAKEEEVQSGPETRKMAVDRLHAELHGARLTLSDRFFAQENAKKEYDLAKKDYQAAQGRLNGIVCDLDEALHDKHWQSWLPFPDPEDEDGEDEDEESEVEDSGDQESGTVPDSSSEKDPAITANIDDLKLTKSIKEKLHGGDVDTVKELEEAIRGDRLRKISGIGDAAVSKIDDAVIAWRDANGYGGKEAE